jgi:hypothetical protein
VKLVLFIAILALAYRLVGLSFRLVRRDRGKVALCWALGVCLFVHCCAFIAVSYFGQIFLVWYLVLGTIPSIYVCAREEASRAQARRAARRPVRRVREGASLA